MSCAPWPRWVTTCRQRNSGSSSRRILMVSRQSPPIIVPYWGRAGTVQEVCQPRHLRVRQCLLRREVRMASQKTLQPSQQFLAMRCRTHRVPDPLFGRTALPAMIPSPVPCDNSPVARSNLRASRRAAASRKFRSKLLHEMVFVEYNKVGWRGAEDLTANAAGHRPIRPVRLQGRDGNCR